MPFQFPRNPPSEWLPGPFISWKRSELDHARVFHHPSLLVVHLNASGDQVEHHTWGKWLLDPCRKARSKNQEPGMTSFFTFSYSIKFGCETNGLAKRGILQSLTIPGMQMVLSWRSRMVVETLWKFIAELLARPLFPGYHCGAPPQIHSHHSQITCTHPKSALASSFLGF